MKVQAKITWTATVKGKGIHTEVRAKGTGAELLEGLRQIFDDITKAISEELGTPVEPVRTVLLEALKKEGQK
ncbi:hypothetical protein V1L52_10150 [Treponema sp. HNW]|uniref:hypothetical protein n=1 Tax=Treponema sp. HNW TaxID=3116654 RepID=UPI003D1501A9